jgi:hypothetical protein
MARYLYSELASTVAARKNCLSASANDSQREWADKHEDTIERLVKQFMPRGSGFDSGTKIDLDRSHASKLVFETAFHHMDENGFYDGWTEHTVTVTPAFVGDFDIRISGQNRNDIKEMMYQDFEYSLHRDCEFECLAAYFMFPAMQSRWIDQCRMVVDVDGLGTFDSFDAAKAAIVERHKVTQYERKAQ